MSLEDQVDVVDQDPENKNDPNELPKTVTYHGVQQGSVYVANLTIRADQQVKFEEQMRAAGASWKDKEGPPPEEDHNMVDGSFTESHQQTAEKPKILTVKASQDESRKQEKIKKIEWGEADLTQAVKVVEDIALIQPGSMSEIFEKAQTTNEVSQATQARRQVETRNIGISRLLNNNQGIPVRLRNLLDVVDSENLPSALQNTVDIWGLDKSLELFLARSLKADSNNPQAREYLYRIMGAYALLKNNSDKVNIDEVRAAFEEVLKDNPLESDPNSMAIVSAFGNRLIEDVAFLEGEQGPINTFHKLKEQFKNRTGIPGMSQADAYSYMTQRPRRR